MLLQIDSRDVAYGICLAVDRFAPQVALLQWLHSSVKNEEAALDIRARPLWFLLSGGQDRVSTFNFALSTILPLIL